MDAPETPERTRIDRGRDQTGRRGVASDGQADEVERLRRRLLRDASLFDDPSSYAAGVEDAIEAVIALDRDGSEHEALTSSGTGAR